MIKMERNLHGFIVRDERGDYQFTNHDAYLLREFLDESYPRDRSIYVTVALFDGKIAHTEEMWIKAHTTEDDAWKEARKNVKGAREAGYSGTGTAIFEVDIDSGIQAMMSVLVGDKQ